MPDGRLPADLAYDQYDYRLTFAETEHPRRFEPHEHRLSVTMIGSMIPNSYRHGEWAPGDWMEDADPDDDTLGVVLRAAVGEAVHEALEWLKVGGRPVLDPHGPAEGAVMDAVHALANELARLARDPLYQPTE